MQKYSRILLFVLMMGTLVLSACGGARVAATPNAGSDKVEANPVAFVGMVDSIAGDQWVINGNTITVAPAVIRDGPFNAGDQVKVEGVVNADGSFTVSRVETPTPEDVSTLPQFGNDNSNDSNVNAGNINDDNSNTGNSNDANANVNDANVNDDNSNAANSNDSNINDDNGNSTNSNDNNGNSVNSNTSNTNDDHSNSGGTNDNGGGDNNSSNGNDNKGGDGNDNGGNSND
jgi:hypothetical protein